jgi:membrane associated rhomboid family serine protease
MNLILLAIIGITCVFSYKGFQDRMFFDKYKYHIGRIRGGDQYRMFSSGFLHADLIHLIFNMYALFIFGPIVCNQLGNLSFIIIYIVSLFGGSFLTYYFHKNDYHYTAIGASGAVTGIIYSAILLYPEMSLYMFFIPIPIPGYVFGIGYLLYSIYGMKAKTDNIGHTAHFGGAIGGFLYTIINTPIILQTNLSIVVLVLIPIVILFVMAKSGKL